MDALHVALIEPYDGGSHRRFREDWSACSAHRITSFTQPARKWKWRMRSSAIHFQADRDAILSADAIVTSGFLNLAEFLGLVAAGTVRGAERRHPPTVLIMHENQLTYPYQTEDERDFHYTFTNVISCLAADAVWFNSGFHRDEFLGALPSFLKRMPESLPGDPVGEIAAKSRVMHLGVNSPLEALPSFPDHKTSVDPRPLRVGWNHRWEFDKRPEAFFAALRVLQERGMAFELVVMGERFRNAPEVFDTARDGLRPHTVHWGYAKDYGEYAALLSSCDVVVSTAAHEFFGISVVEAALCGCALLLPRRLSYPELFPAAAKEDGEAFYGNEADLVERLSALARDPQLARSMGSRLRDEAGRFLWRTRGPELDSALLEVVEGGSGVAEG